jgi:hypothetical protein
MLKQAIGAGDPPPPVPAMAQITIISTEQPVKRPSGSPSPRARG